MLARAPPPAISVVEGGGSPKTFRLVNTIRWYYIDDVRRKHQRTLARIFARPVSANIAWLDVEALLIALGAEIDERAGSRVAVIWDDEVHVLHRPHPSPQMDKGAVAAVRRILEDHGARP